MKKKIFTLLAICVTAVSVAQAADSNMLPGKFSVSATKQVQFAKSNLYWDGSAFQFEANQTDYPTEWNTSHVGHFYWTTLTDYKSGNANYMPYTQTYYNGTRTNSDKFWCGEDNKLTVNGTSDLYVLSSAEWSYLISDRTNASNLYKYEVTVTNNGTSYSNCLVIAPDNYDFTTTPLASSYTLAELNAAGLVCLPLARDRSNYSISTKAKRAYYWTATVYPDTYNSGAYVMYFNNNATVRVQTYFRNAGCSIRLVKTVPPHVHSWATAWTSNDAAHWHACTAEDCPITDYSACGETAAAYGEHSYGSDKTQTAYYTCSVCGHEDATRKAEYHAHSWATTWSSNENGHWHACTNSGCPITDYSTCGLSGAAYSAHTYGSDKTQTAYYTCSVCGHVNSSKKAEYDAENIFDKEGKAVADWDTYHTANPSAIGYTENTNIDKENVFVKQSDNSYKTNKLVVTDGSDFVVPAAIQSANMTADVAEYTRDQSDHTWGTLCLPFDIKAGDGDYEYFELDNVSGSTMSFKQIADGTTIEAGTPVIVKLNGEATVTGNSVKVSGTSSQTAVTSWTLTGTLKALDCMPEGYFFNNDKFWYTDYAHYPADVQVPAYRAYFTTSSQNAPARFDIAVMNIAGEVTAIGTLDSEGNVQVEKYMENGRLYIHRNGHIFDVNGKVVK